MTRLVIRDRPELRQAILELLRKADGCNFAATCEACDALVDADYSALVETAHSGEQGFSIPVLIANEIAAESWLRESRFSDFLAAYSYAATQTHAIGPLAKLTPEESYWLYEILKNGHERIPKTVGQEVDAARLTQNSDTPSPESAVK